MYKNKESAEAVYLAITTNASSHQLSQLKSAANKESIDDGTRGSDGDLGYIRDWQYDPGFVKSVFSLPLKTLSHPVQSSFGWHLVWVDDKRDFLTGERSQC